MLLGIAVAGVPCLALVAVLRRRTGAAWAWSLGLLLWSLATIGVLTLIPTDGAPGVVYADERFYNSCSFDYGGPAPDGFWIVSGGQRLLNAVIFVPSGALLVLVLARWRSARWTIPVGLLGVVVWLLWEPYAHDRSHLRAMLDAIDAGACPGCGYDLTAVSRPGSPASR